MRFSTMWYVRLAKAHQPEHMPSLIRASASRFEYSRSVKLLTEQCFELSLKGGCTDLSEATLVKIPHCWKSHVMAQIIYLIFEN